MTKKQLETRLARMTRTNDRRRRDLDEARTAKMSVDFSFGNVNNQNLDIHDMRWKESADDVMEAFKQARRWAQSNFFIDQLVYLKCAFFNHGYRLEAVDAGKQTALDEWLASNDGQGLTQTYGPPQGTKKGKQTVAGTPKQNSVDRYVREAIREWHIQDNVISFWRSGGMPYLLLPENVKYSDAMGIQKLRVAMGYKEAQLKESGADAQLTPEEVRRYASKEILLRDPKFAKAIENENYLVCTKQLRGRGLGWPAMFSVFRTLSQHESMEVGEAAFAMACRLVVEQHAIGFEAKSTASAHKQADYMYKVDRAKGIMKQMTGAPVGLQRMVTNFDHQIKHVWAGANATAWDSRKWQTTIERLMWWGGPLAWMMVSKSVSPFLLQMLGEQIAYDRRMYVGPHLNEVLNAILPDDIEVTVKWDDRVFNDPRLAWQMVKDLMAAGPLSLKSALEAANFDPGTEKANKQEEAKPANHPHLIPVYDPHHGKGSAPGRKLGSKDGEGQ